MKLESPKPRKLTFYKQFNQESVEILSKSILEIEEHDERLKEACSLELGVDYKPKPIEILIDSYGGSVYQTFGLISLIENCKTPVHTYAVGAAMSGGFMLLISGHKRFARKLSTPMYHQISSTAWGKIQDITEDVKETERLQEIIEKMVTEKTRITKKKLKENREKKIDWFFNAKEALEKGVVDEIV